MNCWSLEEYFMRLNKSQKYTTCGGTSHLSSLFIVLQDWKLSWNKIAASFFLSLPPPHFLAIPIAHCSIALETVSPSHNEGFLLNSPKQQRFHLSDNIERLFFLDTIFFILGSCDKFTYDCLVQKWLFFCIKWEKDKYFDSDDQCCFLELQVELIFLDSEFFSELDS